MHELEETKAELEADPSKLAVLFGEMLQMCLWGNATVSFPYMGISILHASLRFLLVGPLATNKPHARRYPKATKRREGRTGREKGVYSA